LIEAVLKSLRCGQQTEGCLAERHRSWPEPRAAIQEPTHCAALKGIWDRAASDGPDLQVCCAYRSVAGKHDATNPDVYAEDLIDRERRVMNELDAVAGLSDGDDPVIRREPGDVPLSIELEVETE